MCFGPPQVTGLRDAPLQEIIYAQRTTVGNLIMSSGSPWGFFFLFEWPLRRIVDCSKEADESYIRFTFVFERGSESRNCVGMNSTT